MWAKHRLSGSLACSATALIIALAIQSRGSSAGPAQDPTPPGPGINALGLTLRPMPPWFKFKEASTIEGWIRRNDSEAMIGHAWELWAGLTAMTTEKVGGRDATFPIFETWVDESRVFPLQHQAGPAPAEAAPRGPVHELAPPRQLRAARKEAPAGLALAPVAPLVVSVKYTKEMYDHVHKNEYFKTETMKNLNDGWGPMVPTKDRVVKPFPDTSIMLKPTYQVVSGSSATLLPYWAGPAASTTPQAPSATTWKGRMLLLPPNITPIKISGVRPVSISDFYNFRLNAAEADYLNSLGQGTVAEGDYAILVAMHVSSREIDNWTWQTFWWSIDKPKIPDDIKGHLAAPFDHYDTAVGYSFTTGPDSVAGLNVVCFNPYLESGFDNGTFVKNDKMLGIESNCMSCHRAATWPPPSYTKDGRYYTANGILDPGDQYFSNSTKVDFSWGFAEDVAVPPKSR